MRVKTGEVVTCRLSVDVEYHCSACGEYNLSTETVEGVGSTTTLMGINLNRNMYSDAEKNLKANLEKLLDDNNPQRFRGSKLSCVCKKCGHMEPWAKMNPNRELMLWMVSIICAIITLVISLSLITVRPFVFVHYLFFALFVFSAITSVIIDRYMKWKLKGLEAQIALLPKESLPVILPHSKERHDAYRKSKASRPAEKAVYDKWTCEACGTLNSSQYTQCKKCGKYRGA